MSGAYHLMPPCIDFELEYALGGTPQEIGGLAACACPFQSPHCSTLSSASVPTRLFLPIVGSALCVLHTAVACCACAGTPPLPAPLRSSPHSRWLPTRPGCGSGSKMWPPRGPRRASACPGAPQCQRRPRAHQRHQPPPLHSYRHTPHARGPPGYMLLAGGAAVVAFGLWRWAANRPAHECVPAVFEARAAPTRRRASPPPCTTAPVVATATQQPPR